MATGDLVSMAVVGILAALLLVFEVRVVLGFFIKGDDTCTARFTRRRGVRIAGVAAAVLLAAAAVDAFLVEPDWVVREHIEPKLRKVSRRLTIVHISDEGFGARQERALGIVQTAEPDMIVLTGVYLNGSNMEYLPELRRCVVWSVHGTLSCPRAAC
jgi:hypothetical protein